MIEEAGVVVAVDADGIWVATQRKTTCGSCAAKAACGQGILNSLSADKQPQMIKVHSDLHLHEGDQVTLGISEQSLVRSAFIVYMLPLAAMFIAALGMDALKAPEPWIIFAGASGFLGGALWVRLFSSRYIDAAAMQPVIVRAKIALSPGL